MLSVETESDRLADFPKVVGELQVNSRKDHGCVNPQSHARSTVPPCIICDFQCTTLPTDAASEHLKVCVYLLIIHLKIYFLAKFVAAGFKVPGTSGLSLPVNSQTAL